MSAIFDLSSDVFCVGCNKVQLDAVRRDELSSLCASEKQLLQSTFLHRFVKVCAQPFDADFHQRAHAIVDTVREAIEVVSGHHVTLPLYIADEIESQEVALGQGGHVSDEEQQQPEKEMAVAKASRHRERKMKGFAAINKTTRAPSPPGQESVPEPADAETSSPARVKDPRAAIASPAKGSAPVKGSQPKAQPKKSTKMTSKTASKTAPEKIPDATPAQHGALAAAVQPPPTDSIASQLLDTVEHRESGQQDAPTDAEAALDSEHQPSEQDDSAPAPGSFGPLELVVRVDETAPTSEVMPPAPEAGPTTVGGPKTNRRKRKREFVVDPNLQDKFANRDTWSRVKDLFVQRMIEEVLPAREPANQKGTKSSSSGQVDSHHSSLESDAEDRHRRAPGRVASVPYFLDAALTTDFDELREYFSQHVFSVAGLSRAASTYIRGRSQSEKRDSNTMQQQHEAGGDSLAGRCVASLRRSRILDDESNAAIYESLLEKAAFEESYTQLKRLCTTPAGKKEMDYVTARCAEVGIEQCVGVGSASLVKHYVAQAVVDRVDPLSDEEYIDTWKKLKLELSEGKSLNVLKEAFTPGILFLLPQDASRFLRRRRQDLLNCFVNSIRDVLPGPFEWLRCMDQRRRFTFGDEVPRELAESDAHAGQPYTQILGDILRGDVPNVVNSAQSSSSRSGPKKPRRNGTYVAPPALISTKANAGSWQRRRRSCSSASSGSIEGAA